MVANVTKWKNEEGYGMNLSVDKRSPCRTSQSDIRVEGVQRVASEIKSPDELADIEIWNDEKVATAETSTFSDAWITTKAKLSLMTDAGMSPMAVHVDTEDGIVTLFGTVNTQAEKTRAEADVARLDGVKHVAN